MRRILLAAALLAATPAAAQTISCIDKETVTRDLIRNAWIEGKVQECTHKPTGRTFFQPAGSPTPAKAPWETKAAPTAKPATPARPAAASRPAANASPFTLLKDCAASHEAIMELFAEAYPLPSPRSRTLSGVHAGTTFINYYDPAGLTVFGFPVEGLAHARKRQRDHDRGSDVQVEFVYFGIARPKADVIAALGKQPGLRKAPGKPVIFSKPPRSGALQVSVEDDPAGSRIICEWWP